MRKFGFTLLVLGAVTVFFSAIVGVSVPGFGGPGFNVANLPGTLVGTALFIAGAVFTSAAAIVEALAAARQAPRAQGQLIPQDIPDFEGAAILSDDAYRIFLARAYRIEKSDVFDRFICADKLFDNFKDAMKYAHGLYHDRVIGTGKIGLNKFSYEIRPHRTLIQTDGGAVQFESLAVAKAFVNGYYTTKKEAEALGQLRTEQSRPTTDPWAASEDGSQIA